MSAAPRATYRLQFNRDFTFADAAALADYLGDLGVSHVYASPFLKARPGSTHGYDIIDHNELNPEIGTAADFAALTDRLKQRGIGIILDFVPNHMGIDRDNAWWLDVLEWGRASPYAEFFDIDWRGSRPDLAGKVLLAVLGAPYGTALQKGEIRLRFDAKEGSFSAWYYDHRFPIATYRYAPLLRDAGVDAEGRALLSPLAEAFARLREPRSWRRYAAVHAEGTRLKAELAALAQRAPAIAAALARAAERVNGE
ncbi:MAG TPA: alpha-amylase family glycosyl hydrolase, partial [Stellaceae bacterium]|nr:alpha-amylase family glycosyl hydrolase [Stellaceae bacterium]